MSRPRLFIGQLSGAARVLPALVCCLALGCGGGAKLYRVTGNVKFDGNPVPAGKIYFTPDTSKNNSGAPGWADIKDGKYDTAAPGGQGVVGGPMIVKIEGSNGTTPLFANYQTSAELPRGAATQDFDVPASEGKKVPRSVGPPP